MPSRPVAKKKGCLSSVLSLIKLGLVILIGFCLFAIWQGIQAGRKAQSGAEIAGRSVASGPVIVDAKPAPPARVAPGIDEDGVLDLPGGNGVWLATTDADWDDLIDAENRAAAGGVGAGAAIYRMAEAGRARIYANGTRVIVRKTSPLSRFVEVIGGEDAGRSGWVQAEFVRRP